MERSGKRSPSLRCAPVLSERRQLLFEKKRVQVRVGGGVGLRVGRVLAAGRCARRDLPRGPGQEEKEKRGGRRQRGANAGAAPAGPAPVPQHAPDEDLIGGGAGPEVGWGGEGLP